ncbi:MAG: glycosyl transferase family 9 [Bacteroidetes bacterium]|jgi:ADP-heptose:LPS heptosyltransferase|nr:glycosyl transferase family 9 [Bacteroidota bacterium]
MKSTYILLPGTKGDVLIFTTILKSLKEKCLPSKVILFYRYSYQAQILKNNPDVGKLIKLPFSFFYFLWLIKPDRFKNVSYIMPGLFYKKRIPDVQADRFGLKSVEKRPGIYLSVNEMKEAEALKKRLGKYLVVHPYSSSAIANWSSDNWEEIIKSYPGYNFVQIGSKKDRLLNGVVDMRTGKNVRQSFLIVKGAEGFVGVDSFHAHVAAAFNVPSVVLYGPSTPEVFGYDQNLNVYEKTHCSPCMDLGMKNYCPYNTECLSKISVQTVRTAIGKQIKIS